MSVIAGRATHGFSILLLFLQLFGVSAGTNEVGTKFLEENKKREGVITLASGLQYKVLKTGTGSDSPTADSPCECHYAGTTPSLTPDAIEKKDNLEWTEFDSSYKRGSPTTFAPNQVIKGWTEAMQLMVEGDKWEMYIPSELGYGDSGSPPKIKGGDVLIFQMEILKINGKKKPANRCDVKTLEGCDDKSKEYVGKMKETGKEKVETEAKRLEGMAGGTMKDEAKAWLNKRISILKKLKDEL